MVIAVIADGSHHGFCNALGASNDEQTEVHALVWALTNGTGRAILKARAQRGVHVPSRSGPGCIFSGPDGK